jgi:hypothetical protein
MRLTMADLDRLVACGHVMADSRALPRAEDGVLREVLAEVLSRKELVEAAREGLITQREARDVVLAHLWTFICDASRTGLTIGWRDDPVLNRQVEEALFGGR